MPEQRIEQFIFGGVDSRSNPANFPSGRAVRMRNFRPLYSGQLRLRYGYTKPQMNSIIPTDGVIHSAAYYQQYGGNSFVLYGQGRKLNSLSIQNGAVATIVTLGSGNPWGHYRAGNRIFIGNGVDPLYSYDGTTLRVSGIRAMTVGETFGITATASAAAGTWVVTSLAAGPGVTQGYQLYAVLYNPITGAVGNRIAIGSRLQIVNANFAVDLAGLPPSIPGISTELVIGIGRTNDGGEVPYWLMDGSGNRITVPVGQLTATIASGTIDPTQELPTRNGVPPAGLNKFAKVGSRVFAARDGDPNIYYTEDEEDVNTGNLIGIALESWAGNNLVAYPTGEVPTSIHAYRFEGWFFSQTHLSIWSKYLYQQGTNPWRGPWPTGCAGQRAFVETPYGPFWVTPQKEFMGFALGGPVNKSDEYQASLLGKIADANVPKIEIMYVRDPEKHVDQVVILGKDANDMPVTVIHDFIIKDERAPGGQGYEAIYSGMVPATLAGAGFTPRQNVLDAHGRERLWCGAADTGQMYQLEDGTSDGGVMYSGDWIGLVNVGPDNRMVDTAQWQGDANIKLTYLTQPSLGLADMSNTNPETLENGRNNIREAVIEEEARWIFARVQLDSHPADGNFDVSDPPHMPFESYGVINFVMAKIGAPSMGR